MALDRVHDFTAREKILKSLLDLNRRAKELYEASISEGYSENTAWLITNDILEEAQDVMDDLTWWMAPTIKRDVANGMEYFHLAASGTVYLLTATGVPSGVSLFNQMFASGDQIAVRNAEDYANNGFATVTDVNARDMNLGRTLITNSDDETIEFVLYKKSV